jgi:hypothetical protein
MAGVMLKASSGLIPNIRVKLAASICDTGYNLLLPLICPLQIISLRAPKCVKTSPLPYKEYPRNTGNKRIIVLAKTIRKKIYNQPFLFFSSPKNASYTKKAIPQLIDAMMLNQKRKGYAFFIYIS